MHYGTSIEEDSQSHEMASKVSTVKNYIYKYNMYTRFRKVFPNKYTVIVIAKIRGGIE